MNPKRTSALWRRLLGLCLGILVFATTSSASATAQTRYRLEFGDPQGGIGRKLAWRRALQVERERPVIEAWIAAGPERRQKLIEDLDEGVDPRRSRKRLLPMECLSRASRNYWHAAEDAVRLPWFDLLDSVDLRVVPGAFNARKEGRGEAMTVRLTSIWDSLVPKEEEGTLEVSLVWTSPSGEESVARREEANVMNMEDGFDMYIRPPVSEPGVWHLTLELGTPVGLVRSGAVAVECVRDLPALQESLSSHGNSPIATQLKSRLDLLLEYGIRIASTATIASWVEDWKSPQQNALGLHAFDGALVGVPADLFVQLNQKPDAKGVLLVLVKENESPVDLFNGARSAAWAELAEACDLRILAGRVPLSITSAESLAACLAQLEQNTSGPIYVLGRGEAGQLLPSILAKNPELPMDALILSETLGAGGDLPEGLACPVLRVASGLTAASNDASESGEGADRRTRVILPAQDPVAAFQATQVIQSWIQSL